MHGSRALDLALSRFENTTLEKHKNVQEYLNQLESYRMDIMDAGGNLDEPQITSKIIRGLSSKFSPFVDQCYFLQGTSAFADGSIYDITSRLLTFESKHNDLFLDICFVIRITHDFVIRRIRLDNELSRNTAISHKMKEEGVMMELTMVL